MTKKCSLQTQHPQGSETGSLRNFSHKLQVIKDLKAFYPAVVPKRNFLSINTKPKLSFSSKRGNTELHKHKVHYEMYYTFTLSSKYKLNDVQCTKCKPQDR